MDLNMDCSDNRMIGIFFLVHYVSTTALSVEPGFTAPIKNVTAPLGREAIIACTVHNLNTYKVAWLRVETQTILTIHTHVISRSRRVGVTHSDHRVWFLHIRELRETDRGWYMCQINTDPMKSQLGYLDVTVPPDIVADGTSSDTTVREGSPLLLLCRVSGTPKPSVVWRREENKPIKLLNGTKVTSVEGQELRISTVSRDHAGGYLCVASNGVPPAVSKRIAITVEFPPIVTVEEQLVGAAPGSNVMLRCEAEAFPKPVIYWNRHGGDIIPQDDKSEPIKLESWFRALMKLPIRRVSESDYGAYQCIAKNSLGDAEGTIKVYPVERSHAVVEKDSDSNLFGSQDYVLQEYNSCSRETKSLLFFVYLIKTAFL